MIEVSIYYPTVRRVEGKADSDKVRFEFVLPKRPILCWQGLIPGVMIAFPKGYGVAYYDLPTRRVLLAPMPLNILIGFAIWLYQWCRFGAAIFHYKHRPAKPTNTGK
jgi:hypothetical protein